MAKRPIFVPGEKKNESVVYMTEFDWNPGFAISQKQKNITALHRANLICNACFLSLTYFRLMPIMIVVKF